MEDASVGVFILPCSSLLHEAQKVVLGMSVNAVVLSSGLHSEYGLFSRDMLGCCVELEGLFPTSLIFLL